MGVIAEGDAQKVSPAQGYEILFADSDAAVKAMNDQNILLKTMALQ